MALTEYPLSHCDVIQDCPFWYEGYNGTMQCTQSGPLAGICTEGAETFGCLSAVGWAFTVGATYSGFLLLFVGAAWNANLLSKLAAIQDKWRALRAG